MLAQEIHIEFDLAFQNLNSNIRTTFKAEEKDWLFNMATIRWLKKRLNPRSDPKKIVFQGTTKRYEDLEVLMPPPEPLTLYNQGNNLYVALQPSTLQHFIDADVTLLRNCDSQFASQSTVVDTQYVSAINIRIDIGLFTTFTIVIDGTTVFDIANYPSISGGLLSSKQYYYLVNLVIQKLRDSGYEAYWETDGFTSPTFFGTQVIANSIIIRTSTQRNAVVITDSQGAYNFGFNLSQNRIYNFSGVTSSITNPTRLYDREQLSTLLNNSFSKTNYKKPVIAIQNNLIYVYADQKFICSKLILHYLRKPRFIDLSLNIGSELPRKVVLEIIDEAVSMAAVRTSAENYQALMGESIMDE